MLLFLENDSDASYRFTEYLLVRYWLTQDRNDKSYECRDEMSK